MLKNPPSPCTEPGCPKHATERGRCADHQRPAWSTTSTSAHQRGYGAAWRKVRRSKLITDPVCEVCRDQPATEVDHKVAKARGGTDAWDNLQSICATCHEAKTIRERNREARTHGRHRPRR